MLRSTEEDSKKISKIANNDEKKSDGSTDESTFSHLLTPEIKLSAMIDGEEVNFDELEVSGDGNCGFTALGTNREEVVKLFLGCAENIELRSFIADEVRELLIQNINHRIHTEITRKVCCEIISLQMELDAQVRAANDSLESSVSQFKRINLDGLLELLANSEEANSPIELAKLPELQLRLQDLNDEIVALCSSRDIFERYITIGLGGQEWLGYRSAQLFARLKHYSLYVFCRTDSSNQLALKAKEVAENPRNVFYILHTNRFTHYNLLKIATDEPKPSIDGDSKAVLRDKKGVIESKENLFEILTALNKNKTSSLGSTGEENKGIIHENPHFAAYGQAEKKNSIEIKESKLTSATQNVDNLKPAIASLQHTQLSAVDKKSLARRFDEYLEQIEKQLPTTKPDDLEKQLVEALKIADMIQDYPRQVKAFSLMGDIYLIKSFAYIDVEYHHLSSDEQRTKHYYLSQALTRATALFQHSLNMCKKFSLAGWVDILNKKLAETEASYLRAIGKDDQCHQFGYFQVAEDHRVQREKIIQVIKNAVLELEKISKEDDLIARVKNLYEQIYEERKKFIEGLWQECVQILGAPPCDYAVIGLGSFARMEATPYSDFEFAILVAEESADILRYFRQITTLLHLKIIHLGETQLRMLAIESLEWLYFRFQDHTINGLTFDGAKPHGCKTPLGYQGDITGKQNFELIHTPTIMAQFQLPQVERSELYHLPSILGIFTILIHSSGGKQLAESYQGMVIRQLNDPCIIDELSGAQLPKERITVAQMRAHQILSDDIVKFEPKIEEPVEEGKLHKIKFDLFRLPSTIIDGLALYFDFHVNDVWGRLNKLEEKVIQKESINTLKYIYSLILLIRLKTYLAHDGQDERLEILCFQQENQTSNLSNEKAVAIISKIYQLDIDTCVLIYQTLIPLHASIKKFLALKDNQILQDASFKDTSLLTKATIYKRLLQYEAAQSILIKALTKEPENDFAIKLELAYLQFMLGNIAEAYESFKKLLEEFQLLSDLQSISKVGIILAALYNNLGLTALAFDKYTEAKENLQSALNVRSQLFYLYSKPIAAELAISYANLGRVSLTLDKYQEAKEYFLKAYKIHSKNHKNFPHPLIADSLRRLGEVSLLEGDYVTAINYFEQAYKMWHEVAGGKPHPELAATLANMARTYCFLGKYLEAENCYKKTIHLLETIYGSRADYFTYHYYLELIAVRQALQGASSVLSSHTLMAIQSEQTIVGILTDAASSIKENYNLADNEEYYQSALQRALANSNYSIKEVATLHNNLGNHYLSQREYKKSKEHLQKALDLRMYIYEDELNTIELATSHNNLGNVYLKLQEYVEAKAHYEKAHAICNVIYGHLPHPYRAEIMNNIGVLYRVEADDLHYQNSEGYGALYKAA